MATPPAPPSHWPPATRCSAACSRRAIWCYLRRSAPDTRWARICGDGRCRMIVEHRPRNVRLGGTPPDLVCPVTAWRKLVAAANFTLAERNKSNLESLVRFGAEAIPAVDAALDSIDEKGRDSEFDNI